MKHLEQSGNQKKKTRFAGLFFLTGLRPVLRLRRAPLPTGSPLRPARRPTHDWIDVAPIHVWPATNADNMVGGQGRGKVS